jgi:hypothetical protein
MSMEGEINNLREAFNLMTVNMLLLLEFID